jgi:hypothetical protein
MCENDVQFLNVKHGGIYSNNWALKGYAEAQP